VVQNALDPKTPSLIANSFLYVPELNS